MFENASIVVAASSAPNPGHSIFFAKPATSEETINLLFEGVQSPYQARRMLQCGFHVKKASRHRDQLDDRGWALQEKELARRYIAYSGSELQWSCRTLRSCQCRAASLASYTSDLTFQGSSTLPENWWRNLIQEFSHRKLTKAEDCLSAIAGLAKKIESRNHVTYLAGLWTESLVEDLAWSRASIQNLRQVVFQLAPTFSWASIPYGISYQAARRSYGGTRKQHCEVVSWDTERANTIVLRGPVMTGKLSCNSLKDGDQYYLHVGVQTFRSGIYFDHRSNGNGCEFTVDCALTTDHDENVHQKEVESFKSPLRASNRSLSHTEIFKDRPVKLLSLYTISPDIGAAAYEIFLVLGKESTTEKYQRLGLGTGKLHATDLGARSTRRSEPPFFWVETDTDSTRTASTFQCEEICIV